MKITDPEIIRLGELDLIESVQADLDPEAVRQILKDRMSVAALASKGGQIVVHNNEIAFRLDFEVNLSGSLLFDREGNFIEDTEKSEVEPQDAFSAIDPDHEELDDHGFDPEPAPPTPLAEAIDEEGLDDDISIDLPDYDLEEDEDLESPIELSVPVHGDGLDEDSLDPDQDLTDEDLAEEDLIEDEEESFLEDDIDDEDLDLAAEELAIEALKEDDSDQDMDEDHGFTEELDDDENPFGDEDLDAQDLDDDINDILKESREFWEQKKDS